jgi:LPXTG-motif cell wall-anchored protein
MLPQFSEDGVIYDDGDNLFPVFNARLYELPATGSAGTLPFTLGGLLLVATALALLLYKKLHRKEERLFS